jgi:hypothetical protein
MTYSQCGTPVTPIAYCGKHKPTWCPVFLILLRITYGDTGETRHVFMHHLRADGGLPELEEVVDKLPEVTLSAKELQAAMKEAG